MTQREVAELAGVSLRAYQMFEKGETVPQAKNLESILRVFPLEDYQPGPAARDDTVESFPLDVRVFLDMMGAFLSTMGEAERLAFIHDLTRQIVNRRGVTGGSAGQL